jgi:hypothetical protein
MTAGPPDQIARIRPPGSDRPDQIARIRSPGSDREVCQRDKGGQQAEDCRDNAEVDTHRTPPFDMCNQTITGMAGYMTNLISSFPVSKDGTAGGMFVAATKAIACVNR